MLTTKYAPKKLDEIIGNEQVKQKVRIWILKWIKGEKQKALLIYGKPGVGKTSLAYAVANEFGLQIIELSSSQFRDKKKMARILETPSHSVFGKLKLILVDDVDAMSSKDRGGLSELAKVLANPSYPIIITANDVWDKKLSQIRNETIMLEMKKVSPHKIFEFLKKIAEKEKIRISEEELRRIAKLSEGDVRSALLDLEGKTLGFRDRKNNIFEVLARIFKAESLREIRASLISLDMDNEMLKLWISENIFREFEKKEEIAKAYEMLSKGDVFDGRIIRRQYWGFLRYSTLLTTAGVSFAKEKRYHKFTKYSPPSFLKEMSNTIRKRSLIKNICQKIGKRLHISSKKVQQDLMLYSKLITKNKETKEKLSYYFKLNEEEIKFLENLSKQQT